MKHLEEALPSCAEFTFCDWRKLLQRNTPNQELGSVEVILGSCAPCSKLGKTGDKKHCAFSLIPWESREVQISFLQGLIIVPVKPVNLASEGGRDSRTQV